MPWPGEMVEHIACYLLCGIIEQEYNDVGLQIAPVTLTN
jgi:hypothetical protein